MCSLSCELLVSLVAVLECEVVEEEGAGLNEEEVELAGDGSTEEGESMQRAESSDVVELLRLGLRARIQGCSRHWKADRRFLRRKEEHRTVKPILTLLQLTLLLHCI